MRPSSGKVERMDDVVAVEVHLVRGDVGYVITCVRVQYTVDPMPLDGAALEQSRHLGRGATAKRAWRPLVRRPADSTFAPHFYGCLPGLRIGRFRSPLTTNSGVSG